MINKQEIEVENAALKKQVKALELTLQEQQAMDKVEFHNFKWLVDLSYEGIVVHDFEKILYVNDAILQKLELQNKNQIIGKNPLDYVPDDLKEIVSRRRSALLEGNAVQAMDQVFVMPSGKKVEVTVGAVPIRFDKKKAVMLLVNDRSKEMEMSAKNQLLLHVLEQVSASVIITDKASNMEYVNAHLTELTGYSRDELLGNNPRIFSSGRYSKEFYKNMYQTMLKGETWSNQMLNRKKNGESFWEEVHSQAIFDKDGNVTNFFAIQTDVSEKVKLLEDLKSAKVNLKEQVKQRTAELESKATSLDRMRKAMALMLEDLNEKQQELQKKNSQLSEAVHDLESFAYSLSHDLKNPVFNIRDLASFLLKKYASQIDEGGQDMLHDMMKVSNAMAKLIDHILQFARTGIDEPDIVRIDMKPLIYSIFDEVKQSLKIDHARLETGTLIPFEADYPLIKQVVVNLITNALKFSTGQETPTVSVQSTVDGDYVTYAFSDNGVGFKKEEATKLFDIFYRSENQQMVEGTGIGLAIVKKIIERHKGEVFALGAPGKGATFSFKIPVKSKTHAAI